MKKTVFLVVVAIIGFLSVFSQQSSGLLYVSSVSLTIHEKPKFSTAVFDVVKHDTIRVIDSTNKYYLVNYNHYSGTYSGYVLKKELYSWNEYLKRFVMPKNSSDSERLTELQKIFGDSKGLMIFNNMVWVGMTEKEAYYSLGKPTKNNYKIGPWGSQKRLIYNMGGDYGQLLTLYFEDGILQHYITNPH